VKKASAHIMLFNACKKIAVCSKQLSMVLVYGLKIYEYCIVH